MKTIRLIVLGLGLITFIGVKAQVSVENESTVKLGSTNNIISTDYISKYGDATGVVLGNANDKGTLIESGNSEGAGIYMDGDKIIMWSPGDDNLVNFCDEDNMGSSDWHDAIIAYIDGSGYFFQISDSTKKEQITTIESALSKIVQMRGVEYYHKKNTKENDKSKVLNQPTTKKCGFLAQDVEKIIPEAVSTNTTGVKFVNYQAVIPYLVEAIKQQQTQIDQLQKDVNQLKQQLNNGKTK